MHLIHGNVRGGTMVSFARLGGRLSQPHRDLEQLGLLRLDALCQMCHFLLRMAPLASLFMQLGSQQLSLMSLILVHNGFRWLRSLLTAASAKALQHNFEGVDGDHTNQRLQHMCQRRFLGAARVQNGLTNSRRSDLVVLGALRLGGLARR